MKPTIQKSPPGKKAETIDKILREAQAFLAAGRPADAGAELRRKSGVALQHPAGLVLLGQAEGLLGRPEKALAAFEAACRLAPSYPEAHFNRGVFLRRLGRLDEALAAYDASIGQRPGFVQALFNKGIALRDLGRLDEALAVYDAVLGREPRMPGAHLNRAAVLVSLGRLEDALQAFDEAVKLEPRNAAAQLDRAGVLARLGRDQEAITGYGAALKLDPRLQEAQLGLLAAFARTGRGEALQGYDAILAQDPDNAGALLNRGVLLRKLGRIEEALASYDRLLAKTPGNVEALSNRAAAFRAMRRLREAEADYSEAIRIEPDFAEAHLGRAMIRLLEGRFAEGWPDYEYRTAGTPDRRIAPAELPALRLRTEDLVGRSVLLHREQGLGDVLQFGRYLPMVRKLAAEVTVELPKEMRRILAPMLEGIAVGEGPSGRAAEIDIRLLSLPMVLGTGLANIPADIPYLQAEPDLVAFWRERIGGSGFRVGINWQGNPTYTHDSDRSVPLAEFAPLAKLPGIRLISLQRQHGLDQLKSLPGGLLVETLGEDYLFDRPDAFVDAAAAMESLDLVVTSDTAIAHLAGALGKPVFVVLPYVPDWRWLLDREDSPWYPTMRLFRQPKRGDWESVFAAVAKAIAEKLMVAA